MSELHTARGREANEVAEHLRRAGTNVHRLHRRAVEHLKRHLCAFGRAVSGLWPSKPAAHLAHVARISERNANQMLAGDRKVTARALNAVDCVELE